MNNQDNFFYAIDNNKALASRRQPCCPCCPCCLQNKKVIFKTKKLSSKQKVVFKTKINCLIIMNLFDKIKEKAWQAIKRKAVEVIVAILTAAITALTTTSCLGYGPI